MYPLQQTFEGEHLMSKYLNYNNKVVLVTQTGEGKYFLTGEDLIKLGCCSRNGFYWKMPKIKHLFYKDVELLSIKSGHNKYCFSLGGAIKLIKMFRFPNDGLINKIEEFRREVGELPPEPQVQPEAPKPDPLQVMDNYVKEGDLNTKIRELHAEIINTQHMIRYMMGLLNKKEKPSFLDILIKSFMEYYKDSNNG